VAYLIPANNSAGETSSPRASLKIVSSVGFLSPDSIRPHAVEAARVLVGAVLHVEDRDDAAGSYYVDGGNHRE
jgi:hypothetical protein